MYAVSPPAASRNGSPRASASTSSCSAVDEGDQVVFAPVLLVDGDTVLATPTQLAGASVTARVVGEAKGPKINGFTYKNKTNQRRRWGHRQQYATIEITWITKG